MPKQPRIAIFTDKYPLIGPTVWMLSIQYFVAQFIAAAAWHEPAYNWSRNVISDLGNSVCALYADRYICSPDHILMNTSFILLGLTMALGSWLIYQEFKESRWSFAGFGCMTAAGVGTVLVGVFPENTVTGLHLVGASLAFGVGNTAIIILAAAIKQVRRSFRLYTLLTGAISLLAFILLTCDLYLGLGQGGMERLVSYPQTIWLILFGAYMTASHYRRKVTS